MVGLVSLEAVNEYGEDALVVTHDGSNHYGAAYGWLLGEITEDYEEDG